MRRDVHISNIGEMTVEDWSRVLAVVRLDSRRFEKVGVTRWSQSTAMRSNVAVLIVSRMQVVIACRGCLEICSQPF